MQISVSDIISAVDVQLLIYIWKAIGDCFKFSFETNWLKAFGRRASFVCKLKSLLDDDEDDKEDEVDEEDEENEDDADDEESVPSQS